MKTWKNIPISTAHSRSVCQQLQLHKNIPRDCFARNLSSRVLSHSGLCRCAIAYLRNCALIIWLSALCALSPPNCQTTAFPVGTACGTMRAPSLPLTRLTGSTYPGMRSSLATASSVLEYFTSLSRWFGSTFAIVISIDVAEKTSVR